MNQRITPPIRPIGYFVHHQGRGHAERCAAVVNALPPEQPVTVFCARPDMFPAFSRPVDHITLPSLFEPTGHEDIVDDSHIPDTVHCAPLGWPGIRTAMARLTDWFATANPVMMISDVSAEVAQLARLCSVPHVMVLQHGRRDDAGHMAAYDGAVGLLCPAHRDLAQDNWTTAMRAKTHFAAGLGVQTGGPDRATARKALGFDPDRRIILVMSGGGGSGFASAPLGVGARAMPDTDWITIGKIDRDWHATEPRNLRHDGWVDGAADYLAACDLVIASTGNTTCHQILAQGLPWLAIPEWRYFDEQICKAEALQKAGAATVASTFPASASCWRRAIARTLDGHDAQRQRRLITPNAARDTADWLLQLARRLCPDHSLTTPTKGAFHAASPIN